MPRRQVVQDAYDCMGRRRSKIVPGGICVPTAIGGTAEIADKGKGVRARTSGPPYIDGLLRKTPACRARRSSTVPSADDRDACGRLTTVASPRLPPIFEICVRSKKEDDF